MSGCSVFGCPPPTPTPPVTTAPAPTTSVVTTSPFGPSSFGSNSRYTRAGHLDTRRPGWSWTPLNLGVGPFCYESTCLNVTDVCLEYDGTVINDHTCSFPDNVNVVGVSCFENQCFGGGQAVCNQVGGTTLSIAGTNQEWCIYESTDTFLGPACYNGICFPNELKAFCDDIGGRVWNDVFCLMNGAYTVIGPLCWGEVCFTGNALQDCDIAGGRVLASRWCVVPGCDNSVLGPFCFGDECFDAAGRQVCNMLGGQNFANGRHCLVKERNDLILAGPTCYENCAPQGATDAACEDAGGSAIDGRWCLFNTTRRAFLGPDCVDDSQCNTDIGTFCDDVGGFDIERVICLLPPGYRQAVGPLLWNDLELTGPADICVGNFCAIPTKVTGEPEVCPNKPTNPFETPTAAPTDRPFSTPSPTAAGNAYSCLNALVVVLLVVTHFVRR